MQLIPILTSRAAATEDLDGTIFAVKRLPLQPDG